MTGKNLIFTAIVALTVVVAYENYKTRAPKAGARLGV